MLECDSDLRKSAASLQYIFESLTRLSKDDSCFFSVAIGCCSVAVLDLGLDEKKYILD